MGTTEENRIQGDRMEFPAGGLVWTTDEATPRFAVVHRVKRRDWTLPGGRLDAGESLDAPALRDAMEATGHEVLLGRG